MTINRNFFFEEVREKIFHKGLLQDQVDGIEAILDEWEKNHAKQDDRWLAYMLATAYHETAHTMQPVRETLASTDEKAAAILQKAFDAGKLPWVKNEYWKADADGKRWLGRGLVQLTHKDNYKKLSGPAGVDLVADPAKAMDMDVAVRVMFAGMIGGLFTGKSLQRYFDGDTDDWINARQIINGLDRAALIAGYGRGFYAAISYKKG